MRVIQPSTFGFWSIPAYPMSFCPGMMLNGPIL